MSSITSDTGAHSFASDSIAGFLGALAAKSPAPGGGVHFSTGGCIGRRSGSDGGGVQHRKAIINGPPKSAS